MSLPTFRNEIATCNANITKLEAMLSTAEPQQKDVITKMLDAYRTTLATFIKLAEPLHSPEAYERLFPASFTR